MDNGKKLLGILGEEFHCESLQFRGHSLFMRRGETARLLPIWLFAYLRTLLLASKSKKIVLIFNHIGLAYVALVCKKLFSLRFKVIVYLANMAFITEPRKVRCSQRVIYASTLRFVIGSSDGVAFNRDAGIPTSLKTLARVRKDIPEPVVDTDAFKLNQVNRTRIRMRYLLTERENLVGLVGPFHKNNALPSVEYVRSTIDRFSEDTHFLFIGAIAKENTFAHPRVYFAGYVDDLPAYLSACDCLLLPRFVHYGSPMGKAIHAMAVSLPVITNRLEGMPLESGSEVVLGSLDELPSLTRELLAHRENCRSIGRKAREAVVRLYSIDIWRRDMPELVKKVWESESKAQMVTG